MFTNGWAFFDTTIIASSNRLVVMTHQNLSAGNYFEPSKSGFSKKQLAINVNEKINFMNFKSRLQAVSLFLKNPWRKTQNKWAHKLDYECDIRWWYREQCRGHDCSAVLRSLCPSPRILQIQTIKYINWTMPCRLLDLPVNLVFAAFLLYFFALAEHLQASSISK